VLSLRDSNIVALQERGTVEDKGKDKGDVITKKEEHIGVDTVGINEGLRA
jgi:hypothetical protein